MLVELKGEPGHVEILNIIIVHQASALDRVRIHHPVQNTIAQVCATIEKKHVINKLNVAII